MLRLGGLGLRSHVLERLLKLHSVNRGPGSISTTTAAPCGFIRCIFHRLAADAHVAAKADEGVAGAEKDTHRSERN